MYLGCRGLRWNIPFINRETNQWETPGISTIALIALRYVPIALWLSPNSYNVCKKSRTWLTQLVGVEIKLPSVAEVQPSPHWCVVCGLYADPPWCSDDLGNIRWQSRCWEVPDKIAATSRLSGFPDWVLKVCSWLLEQVLMCWYQQWCCPWFHQLHKSWEPQLRLPTGTYHLGCCPNLCKFGQHSSNYTKWGKNIGIKV